MHAEKDTLRQKMRQLRLALGADEATRLGALASAHALSLAEVATAGCVALYAPVRGEIDTRPLHDALATRGVVCVYPRLSGSPALRFAAAAPATLVAGRHGIPEPPASAVDIETESIDVFIVPGLAFDLAGERLGWGGGHYDRTLAGAPAAARIGFAFGFQIVPAVPVLADDEHVDFLVTEEAARRTTKPHLRRLR